jgi:hypothetical protein
MIFRLENVSDTQLEYRTVELDNVVAELLGDGLSHISDALLVILALLG